MGKKYSFRLRYFFSLVLFGVIRLYAQTSDDAWQDNPNFDHVPPDYFNSINYDYSPEAVITVDGWDNFDLGVDYAEPHMSINPLNPVKYLNAWNINNTHYTQNGFDWSTLAPSFGVSPAGDPVTAYDSLGNLFYETMYGSISGCKVIRSTNNGQTWSTAVTSISGNDKNWIACDQTSGPYANYVYTTMTPGNFARSTDHGATFQTTATLASQTLPGMMVCVGPDNTTGTSGGCVYVVTHSGTNGAGTYTFYRSTNGGTSFVQRSVQQFSNYIGTEIGGRSTVNGMRTRPYPMIAADNSFGPHRGRLYLVYASNQPAGSGNKPNIFFRYSDDQAATWSSAVVVNDDPNTAANHNFFPAIWCDKQTGRLYIKWYDSRLCPTSDSMDVYATYTDNGGASFAPNQRITNKTFKTKLSGSGTPPVYQGDYDAVSGVNNQALLVWTDFRNDNYGSYVAYFPDFAMLTSVSNLTLGAVSDSTFFNVRVPAVKLYTNTATFTTEIIPTPSTGQILVTPVGSNVLSTYPDSVVFKVKTVGPVPLGSYTILVTGKGPNGTPVHKRSIELIIQASAPSSPILISPQNAAVNQPVNTTFLWRQAPTAVKYWLQISQDSLFASLIFQDSLITDTSKYISLLNNNKYFWRVKAINNVGQSGWSDCWNFYTVVQPPLITSIIAGGGQIILSWSQDPSNNINGYKIFRDSLPGATTFLAMVGSGNYNFIDTGFTENIWYYYRIKAVTIYGNESDFSNEVTGIPIETYQLSVNIDNNWNIVSIPGLLPYNQNVASWWSGKDPAASVFKFQGSYQVVNTVEPGTGYWMKHLGSNLYNTGDEWPSIGIQMYAHNPIPAAANWNLIGGYEDTVATVDITTTPPGLRTGPVYRYFEGYLVADYLIPGRGYWVKMSAPGFINIPGGGAGPAKIVSTGIEDFGKMIFTDAAARTYTLYISKAESDLSQFELPPLPPNGLFDIRYSAQRYAEDISSIQGIELQGVQYPVTVRAEKRGIILSDETGKEIARLKDGEQITLNTTAKKFYVLENAIPTFYSLSQNYPNPFNPGTTIEFSIPEDVNNIKLMVYNALGEKIAELVNTELQAGVYKYPWDAGSFASGIYIYQLVTEKFVSTKKMILMK